MWVVDTRFLPRPTRRTPPRRASRHRAGSVVVSPAPQSVAGRSAAHSMPLPLAARTSSSARPLVRACSSRGASDRSFFSLQWTRSRLARVTSAQEMWTRRSTPAWRAALSTFSVPATLTHSSALGAARCEATAAACTTASHPRAPSSTSFGSATLPANARAPADTSALAAAALGSRTSTCTVSPSWAKRRAIAPPTKPVAPVTRTFTPQG